MASLQSVYGGGGVSAHPGVGPIGATPMDSVQQLYTTNAVDNTPKAVAVMLILMAGVIYLLKYYGIRFNFGVTGGR